MPERLFFIQHGLSRARGHWLRETRQWAAAARARGFEWHGFAHRDFDPTLAASLDVKAVIPFKPFDMLKVPPPIAPLASFIEFARTLAHCLYTQLPTDISARDVVFVAYTTPTELFGIAEWLDQFPPDKRPRVACMFHQLDPGWKIDPESRHVSGDFQYWTYGARAIAQRLSPAKLRLYAAGVNLTDVLWKIFNLPVSPLHLMMTPFQDAFRPQAEKTYDLGVLNSGRSEQGGDVTSDILVSLLKMRPATRILVQAAKEEQAQAFRQTLNEALGPQADAQVDIVSAGEDESEYERRLADVRLLLMSYQPERYCFRDSGIFSEAASRALPVAASRFSSMAGQIEAGHVAGAVFPYGDIPVTAACLNDALNGIAALSARAEALAPAWRAAHDPRTIVERAIGASWQ